MSENLMDMVGSSEESSASDDQTGTTDNNQTEQTSTSGDETPSEWYFSTDVKGEGETPEWFQSSKYKTVEDQAKAYPEARKALGAFTGSPDEYTDELGSDYDVKFDPEDGLLTNFKEFAKNSKMSQESYTEALKIFVDYTKSNDDLAATASKENAMKELEKIGDNASQKLNDIVNWYDQNFASGDKDKFKNMIKTADDYEVLSSLREGMKYTKTASSESAAVPTITAEQLRERINDPKEKTDPAYQRETMEMYKRAEKQGLIR